VNFIILKAYPAKPLIVSVMKINKNLDSKLGNGYWVTGPESFRD
jgi:hypothetical protein